MWGATPKIETSRKLRNTVGERASLLWDDFPIKSDQSWSHIIEITLNAKHSTLYLYIYVLTCVRHICIYHILYINQQG